MHKTKELIASLVVFLLLVPAAWAGPKVGISVIAEKLIEVKKNGKIVEERVSAETVMPGEVIFYTLQFNNNGDQKATRVMVNNPVPDGAAYLEGSAYGKGSVIAYSVDNGETFGRPKALVIKGSQVAGSKIDRPAKAAEYTHIRWVIEEIDPGANGVLGFKVVVK